MENDISDLISTITKIKNGNGFKNYIEYIRFPFYKNLEPDTRIDFDFPLTVFVGQNGCGKSSALEGIYGCPYQKSPGEFWFSTKIDPITGKEGASLIYSYDGKEVLKRRNKRKKKKTDILYDPDYFETDKPLKLYGMVRLHNKSRVSPIKKNVLYLNFRKELSAFDKCMYFSHHQTKTIHTIKDYIRKYSKYLYEVIKTDLKVKLVRGVKRNEEKIILDGDSLNIINKILGKNYNKCILLYHNFYKSWGLSIYFETNSFNYSEAFAGSGEFNVVKLVYEILQAPEESLILLDEPEVSLHPGAQEKLKLFLLTQIKEKKHQIVVSTHSPSMICDLPSKAIKSFVQLANGKFHIEKERTPEEAFYYIGYPNLNKKTIYVEDKLAKELIEAVLKDFGDKSLSSLFEIQFNPGGAESSKKSVSLHFQSNHKHTFFLLDGDKKREHFQTSNLTEKNRNPEFLKNQISQQTGIDFNKIGLYLDGNKNKHYSKSNSEIKDELDILLNYLRYYDKHVNYLPIETPEEIIWDQEYAANICKNKCNDELEICTDYKDKFKHLAQIMTGEDSSSKIFTFQQMFITNWIAKNKNKGYYMDFINYLHSIKE